MSSTGEYTPFFIARKLQKGIPYNSTSAYYRVSNIFLGSKDPAGVSLASCTIEPVFVMSAVNCKTSLCTVTKMRRAESYAKGSYFWTRDLMAANNNFTESFGAFALSLSYAIPGAYSNEYLSTPTEMYISGDESYPFASSGRTDLYKTPIDDFSRRLGTIVNTYWLSSMAAPWSTGNLQNTPLKQVINPHCDTTPQFLYGVEQCLMTQTSTANVTHLVEVYICHIGWLALLVVASTLLCLIAVVGTVLRWMTTSPNILGYASTLTMDNPYIYARGVSSAMDGLDRTRALSDLRLRLADVRSDDQYGHVAVCSVDQGRSDVMKGLPKRRLYL